MFKKLALPVVALAAMLTMTSAPAKAAVRFGVTVGPPVYTYPAAPYVSPYYDPYVDPYYDPYYVAPAPVYTYPSFGFGYYGGHRDHDDHFEHGRTFRGFEGHERGGGGFSRGFSGGHAGGGHRR